MEPGNTQLALNHLRVALRNGLVLQVAVFALGCIGGWGIASWSRDPVRSVSVAIGALVPASWFIWAYYRTSGLLHHGGFGKWNPEE
jgi:hypothetical protein